MALLHKSQDGRWELGGNKHSGELLETVAEEDPGYLKWMFRKASDGLSKEAFDALETTLDEHDIDPFS